MYKIIIVDDEIDVRKGMINKLDFNKLGYEFVGEAENGVEALEVIEAENPDLAIIDIKMPYMDGLELAREIHKNYPALKVIILSGFDDFEFARQAIRYNVMDYVLKPVSSNDIVELLQSTKLKLDEEKSKKRDLMHLEKHYLESLPIIRERFLNALVLEKHGIKNLNEKLSKYNISIGKEPYIVAIVRPDQSKAIQDEVFDIYAYGIYETCKTLVEDKLISNFHNHAGDTVLIIPNTHASEWMHTLEEIRAVVEKTHLQTVTIGLGERVQTIDQLHHSYQGAVQALGYKLIEGDNKVIWIKDLEPNRLKVMSFIDYENDFNQIIRSCDQAGFDMLVDSMFNEVVNSKMTLESLSMFMMELLLFLLRLYHEYQIQLKWFMDNQDLYKALQDYKDIDALKSLIRDIGSQMIEAIGDTRKTNIKVMIDTAIDYLEKHFSEEISLESVADYLHISPEYLSRLFKKETTKTFIHYLTTLRLEAAKRLIEDTQLKNFEVAEKVGYNEPNYFSYVFKKRYGISPSKYRKSIKGSL
ncbi:response regulator [Acidaminobacter sp. JC074]|uniref:response regulator n=1 Tax=Acidaminobacter sp. JC074 TaxID=2530199 RepID=UPI001F0EA0AA|nr:response regulator [Acidaminobacter sp. JC074]MCH4888568.1 response regulator [Acidaminobacter sp. JC074]